VLPHLAYAISLNEDLNFQNSLISDHKLWEHPRSHGMGMSYSSVAIHGYKLLLLSHLHQVLDPCKFHWVRLLVDPYNYMMDEIVIVDPPRREKLIIQEQDNGPRILQVLRYLASGWSAFIGLESWRWWVHP
jgi:hypothetical protein